MNQVLAMRLHLADCRAENGALKVLPGTHRDVPLGTAEIEQLAGAGSEVVCEVPAGGAVLMNPLLFHASSPMSRP